MIGHCLLLIHVLIYCATIYRILLCARTVTRDTELPVPSGWTTIVWRKQRGRVCAVGTPRSQHVRRAQNDKQTKYKVNVLERYLY